MLRQVFSNSIKMLPKNIKRSQTMSLYNRSPRMFFSETKDEEPQPSSFNILDQVKLTEEELKKTPLEKSTLKKLAEPYGADVYKRLKDEFNYFQKLSTENGNIKKELNSMQTIYTKNKDAIEKLKKMVQEEKEEGERIAIRLKKEIEKEKIFAVSKFSTEILEVIDNIERLIENCKVENDSQTYQGMFVIYNSALNVLKRFGIQKIPSPLGQQVDLDFHEIVFHAPYPGKPNGEVLDVSQTGYVIGDRVLRASKVGVVKNL